MIVWFEKEKNFFIKPIRTFNFQTNGGDLAVLRREAFVLCRTNDTVEIIKSRKLEISTLATLSSLKVSLSMSGLVLFDSRLFHVFLMVSSQL